MAIAANDVNVISVETADLDFRAGVDPIEVTVEAEAGSNLISTGGKFLIRMTLTDTTNPALLDSQQIDGIYGVDWTTEKQTFPFTVPPLDPSRAGNIIEPQARVISGATPPFDASHAVGARFLLTQ